MWKKRREIYLPLYEAKMVQMYDHRAASVVVQGDNWMRQGQTDPTSLVQHQNPEYTVEPRWWVPRGEVDRALNDAVASAHIVYKDVTSPTNTRTMIASFIPHVGTMNSAPLILTGATISERRESCLLANLNSFVLDFVARQKVGGIHLNFFIVEQFSIFGPEFYDRPCPWDERKTLESWISERVLKLTCTSNDMKPLAEAAGFQPLVYRWDPSERAELQAELDAAFFLLYGVERDDVAYILSTFSGLTRRQDTLLTGTGSIERILRHYDRLLPS